MENRAEKQWQFLEMACCQGTLPQAMIFSGPFGSSRKETALKLARVLLCLEKRPCFICPSCLSFKKGLHPDFMEVRPEKGQITISQVRFLQKQFSLKAQLSSLKIAVIEQADKMNIDAQHCFLKTLEEPAGETVFILLTSFPELLLPTVRSRCAHLKFYLKGETPLPKIEQAEQLLKQGLAGQFAFAEKHQDSLEEFTAGLLGCLRRFLLSKLKNNSAVVYSFEQLSQMLRSTNDLLFLFKSSNINKRLAFENLMLSFPELK